MNTQLEVPQIAGDPRPALKTVIDSVGALAANVKDDDLSKSTPCAEFSVADLLDHIIFVLDRVGVIGEGYSWSTVEQQVVADRPGDWAVKAGKAVKAWADDSKLGKEYEVPWGRFPGAAILVFYIGELAVHGRDLAEATDQELALSDELLTPSLAAAKMIPAEGRPDDVPFDPPSEVAPDAPILDQMAAWMGRKV